MVRVLHKFILLEISSAVSASVTVIPRTPGVKYQASCFTPGRDKVFSKSSFVQFRPIQKCQSRDLVQNTIQIS